MSVGMSVPGVWDAARQHKKRAALTDKQLRDTYESLKRNNWSRPETARRLLVGEPVLNARIRMLKRLGLEVPEPVLPRRNPANKKSRRFSVAELNEAHRALVDNAWDRRMAAEELGVSSDRMYNLVGALKRLGFKVEEGPLDPKSAGQSTPSQQLIINPGRIAEVLEAVFYQPGPISVPPEGRGIPQLKAVELGKQKLAVLLRVKPGSVAKFLLLPIARDTDVRCPGQGQSLAFAEVPYLRQTHSIITSPLAGFLAGEGFCFLANSIDKIGPEM